MWIDQAMSKLSNEKSYHRDDLYQIFVTVKDDLTDSVFRWTLYKLLLEKHLFRTGYNTYVTKQPVFLPVYQPVYSDAAGHILNLLSEKYSEIPFVVFAAVFSVNAANKPPKCRKPVGLGAKRVTTAPSSRLRGG